MSKEPMTFKEPTTSDSVPPPPDHRFLIGFLMGGIAGAGLALLCAPRVAAELRQRVTGSARDLGRAATERYRRTSTRVGEAVGDLARKGQGVRDEVLEAVVSGAQKVERFAVDHATSKPHPR